MKKDIHPQVNPVVFVDTSSGARFITTSTLTSEKTEVIDGIEHYVINIEISSASHPFFTGNQVFVDTARRLEKFQNRLKKVEEVSKNRRTKKAKRAARQAKKQQDKDNKK